MLRIGPFITNGKTPLKIIHIDLTTMIELFYMLKLLWEYVYCTKFETCSIKCYGFQICTLYTILNKIKKDKNPCNNMNKLTFIANMKGKHFK